MSNHSSKLDAGDLLAYIEGKASAEIRAAIERDHALLDEINAIKETQNILSGTLTRTECPDSESLLLFQSDLLTDVESIKLEDHIASCTHCLEDLKELRIGISEPKPLDKASKVRNPWRILDSVRVKVARRPSFAIRGHETHRYFHEVDQFQVTVACAAQRYVKNRWEVEGQFLDLNDPLRETPGTVKLFDDSAIEMIVPLEPYGMFKIRNIPPGTYNLHVETETERIQLADIELESLLDLEDNLF